MPNTIRVQSPLRGVNRALGRESQPPDTVWDALNVFPFDRYGRLRVGQRPGLGALTTLDNHTEVRLLHVASSANANLGTSTVTLLNEPFTYSNGNLATVSSNKWISYKPNSGGDIGYGNLINWSATANAMVVSSNTVQAGTTYLQSAAVSQTALTLGTNYDISLGIVVGNTEPNMTVAVFSQTIVATHDSGQFLGAQVSTANGGGIVFLEVFDINNTTTFTIPSTIGLNATHTLGLRRRGNDISVLWDGTVYATQTGSVVNSDEGVAFFIDGTSGPEDLTTVDNFLVTQPVVTSIDRTTLQLVATDGADTFVGTPTDMSKATNSASHPIDATAIFVSAATLFGFTYIVDGNGKPKKLDLSDNTMVAFTESAGTVQSSATIAASWRGRLLLSGVESDPQNLFASRAGNPLDWDYSQTDPAAAFVLNAASSGKVGQPIHALIPVSDDVLLIGCEQSVFRLRGDPADGGACDLIADTIGVSSSTSWCRTPDGSTYFVGPRGFFRAIPTGETVEPVDITAYPQFFQNINRATNYINLIYDADKYGIWIMVSPITEGNVATSMFYDLRIGKGNSLSGFWPQRFTHLADAGPVSAVYWDGYDSDTRYPIFGGYTGTLYATNATNRSDNGGAIDASVTFGPFHPSEGASILSGTTFDFGELSSADSAVPDRWQASVTLRSGKTAYDVTEGTPTGTVLVGFGRDRRTKTIRQKLRGEWFTVEVSDASAGNYFTLESTQLEFEPAGRNRRQR